jgi:hypothetical protein
MKRKEFFDRISFPTEYRSRDELKTSIVLLFFTCLIFFILSSIMITLELFLFSKTLLLGTISYELILFFLLNDYTKKFIKKEIKGKPKKTLNITTSLIFGSLMLLTFLTLVYSMITPTPVTENKFVSLTAALLIIIAPNFFWHELVMYFKKRALKMIKFLGVGALLFLVISNGAVATTNVTNNQTSPFDFLNNITQGISWLEKIGTFFTQAKDVFSNIQTIIQDNLHLTAQQTQAAMLIGVLIIAFMFLKFLSVIVKWVIVILIVWIIIQMIFL